MAGICGKFKCSYSLLIGGQRLSLIKARRISTRAHNVLGKKRMLAAASPGQLQSWGEILKTLYRNSSQKVSSKAKTWWDKYEEFVGLVEVREAQANVAEAEKAFMVARAVVRDVREEVEFQQVKLKEVRDRLDRVSREDVHYLELATQEHRLLQEEKRIRASFVHAEDTEREKFALFSAAVRESHDKERTRAERTKNWSIIGSILGAIIGVVGSTYINRVRLYELKSLLLEAQKGPLSLQEAVHEQACTYKQQQKDLNNAIVSLQRMICTGAKPCPPLTEGGACGVPCEDPLLVLLNKQSDASKQIYSSLECLHKQVSGLGTNLCKVTSDVKCVKAALASSPCVPPCRREGEDKPVTAREVMLELIDTKQSLESHINRSSVFSTGLTCAVFAFTIPALYILLKGS
ncbi:mitochondrial potassium channel [Ambystoma mexicanum]|uniref:mitochondrial potassium channel n=1 Tax=Ambystoma mexicanum TaxID=8296 RepID=UPI0037E854B6